MQYYALLCMHYSISWLPICIGSDVCVPSYCQFRFTFFRHRAVCRYLSLASVAFRPVALNSSHDASFKEHRICGPIDGSDPYRLDR